MAQYFLIESSAPFDSGMVKADYQLAANLANAANEVTLFLVENGVLAARSAIAAKELAVLSGVKLLADGFSLQERGITPDEIGTGITVTGMDSVIEAMTQGQKVIWLEG